MNPPELFDVITMSGFFGSEGSLLVPMTLNVPGASPESESAAVTVATFTIFWSGGQIVQPGIGIPEMTGGALSILTTTGRELESPAPLTAEQVSVVPVVFAFRVAGLHALEDEMPDSGSVTLQLTVTLPVYQPLPPSVPAICGTMTGGVVSNTEIVT